MGQRVGAVGEGRASPLAFGRCIQNCGSRSSSTQNPASSCHAQMLAMCWIPCAEGQYTTISRSFGAVAIGIQPAEQVVSPDGRLTFLSRSGGPHVSHPMLRPIQPQFLHGFMAYSVAPTGGQFAFTLEILTGPHGPKRSTGFGSGSRSASSMRSVTPSTSAV